MKSVERTCFAQKEGTQTSCFELEFNKSQTFLEF